MKIVVKWHSARYLRSLEDNWVFDRSAEGMFSGNERQRQNFPGTIEQAKLSSANCLSNAVVVKAWGTGGSKGHINDKNAFLYGVLLQ